MAHFFNNETLDAMGKNDVGQVFGIILIPFVEECA